MAWNTKSTIGLAIEIVGAVFAAFGHFLVKLAPPKTVKIDFAVGISSLIALLILLFIKALQKNWPAAKYRKWWLVTAATAFILFGVTVVFYKNNLSRYTYDYPENNPYDTYLAGNRLTPAAAAYISGHPGNSVAHMVADFGGPGNSGRIWDDSPGGADAVLTWNYVLLTLTFFLTLFSLTEGLLSN